MLTDNNTRITPKPVKTIDEIIVPDMEQEFSVPQSWCWVKQGAVSTFINGRAYKQAELLEDQTATPVLRVGNLFTNGSWYYSDLSLEESKYIDYGDLIYAWSASFGPFIWEGGRVIYHYHIWKITPTKALIKKYYYYWLMHDTERLKKQGHGTGMIHVTKEMMESSAIPLPPLPEQQRIVDRIESLFAKLDEAKEKAQAVVDGLEDRIASIRHKAFTGELIGSTNRKMIALEKIAQTIRIGPFGSALHKEDYVLDGIPVINPKHIVNQQIIPEEKVGISLNKADELSNYRLRTNDIILGRRGDMGRSAPVTIREDGWLCGTGSLIIRLKEGYDASFYSQIIASHASVQYFEENCVGSTMKNLNENIVRNLPVPEFSINEQKSIVMLFSDLIKKEENAKESSEAIVEQIDVMKKSILARAFRGELGTNDPNDESVIELLKKVLSDEPTPQPRKRVITLPKNIAVELNTELERKIVKLFIQKETDSLPIKELMSVSSKPFEVLETLHELEKRGIISKEQNNNNIYKLMR